MRYTAKSINQLPQLPGVYIFRNRAGYILYIGKGKDLRKRIVSYFQKHNESVKTHNLVNQIYSIEVILAHSELEALLLEAKLIKQHQPKYNVIWKDDKHYIYIKITTETFPRVLFSRRGEEDLTEQFGPFPSNRVVRELLNFLRSVFPYCSQNPKIKRSCFYAHLGLCNPCPSDIVKKKGTVYQSERRLYLSNIRQIKLLLSGRINTLEKYLGSMMKFFSNRENYEQAAQYRDRLNKIKYILSSFTSVDTYMENPKYVQQSAKSSQNELTTLLKNYYSTISRIKRIECYDVSYISGKFATGSLVTFIDGLPVKDYYRRFKIKITAQNDDFAMLSEVLHRRLLHKEWVLPDLLIVDGGTPQLIAFKKVLLNLAMNIPVIGLAKQLEEIVIPTKGKFLKLKLPVNSLSLQLIQRLRDEAHRFAHNYHQLLRLKYLISN